MTSTHRRAIAIGAAFALTIALPIATVAATSASATTLNYPAPHDVSVDSDIVTSDNPPYDPIDGRAEIDFVAPSLNADSDVLLGYTAKLLTGPSYATTVATTVTTNLSPNSDEGDNFELSFGGLTFAKSYEIAVQANYATGDSLWSTPPPFTVYAPFPDATISSITPGNHSLHVTWKPVTPTTDTGPLGGYVVVAFDEADSSGPGDLEPVSVSSTTTSATVTGLTNGHRYVLGVAAQPPNSEGFGIEVDDSAPSGVPIGSPAKPAGLKVTWHSGGHATFRWKSVHSSSAAPVTGYQVYVNGALVKTVKRGTDHVGLTGEHKGRTYTFAVRAYNAVGHSHTAHLKKKRTVS